MKAKRAEMERALRSPADWRFFLLHGPDEAGSQSLIRVAAAGAGAEAERVDLTGSELKADPARLADEAASLSLFGGARYIVVQPAGDFSTRSSCWRFAFTASGPCAPRRGRDERRSGRRFRG